jgi:hypothetical protein
MPRITFTDDEKKLINACAHAVWREIGFDILTAVAEIPRKGKALTVESATVSQDEIIELVLDADRLKSMMERRLNDMGRAIYGKIEKAEHRTVMRLMREVFPYSSYGA